MSVPFLSLHRVMASNYARDVWFTGAFFRIPLWIIRGATEIVPLVNALGSEPAALLRETEYIWRILKCSEVDSLTHHHLNRSHSYHQMTSLLWGVDIIISVSNLHQTLSRI